MSRTRTGNWPDRLWDIASALGLIAAAAVAVGATILVFSRGNAVPSTYTVGVGQANGGTTKSDQYNPASIGISAGDTVRWEWFGGTHDVASFAETAPGVPEWQSSLLRVAGNFFEHQFAAAGTYTYYCSIHAFPADAAPDVIDANITAGKMVGKVVVAAPATPTPTPSPAPPTPTPASSPVTPTPPPPPSPTSTAPASPTPGMPSVTPEPTSAPSPVASPTATPAPSAAATVTPTPAGESTPTPPPTAPATPAPTAAPTAPPALSPTPTPTSPASTPPPTPGPTLPAAPTPAPTAPPSPVNVPAPTPGPNITQGSPTPGPTVAATAPTATPSVLGLGAAPRSLPEAGAIDEDGGGLGGLATAIPLLLTAVLIAVVSSGFIWIERAGRGDQPR